MCGEGRVECASNYRLEAHHLHPQYLQQQMMADANPGVTSKSVMRDVASIKGFGIVVKSIIPDVTIHTKKYFVLRTPPTIRFQP